MMQMLSQRVPQSAEVQPARRRPPKVLGPVGIDRPLLSGGLAFVLTSAALAVNHHPAALALAGHTLFSGR